MRPGSNLLPIRVAVALGAISAGCTEQYTPFHPNQLTSALAAAERVRVDRLAPTVEAIYAARVDDPERELDHPRDCGTGSQCVYSRAATRALIRERWNSADLVPGARLSEQALDDGRLATTNLFLDIPGTSRPQEWVLATAHYDAWFGGANDDASGVAVTLEAAFALQSMELDRSVRLLLVDGEELGMVGSGRYVEQYGTDGVVMVLNADMIAFRGSQGGFFTREDASVEYLLQANADSAAAAYAAADLARRLPEPVAMKPLVYASDGVSLAGVVVGYALSDHAQFWLAGTPALFPFPTGDKPAWYHTENDTPEQLDRDRLRRFGQLWAASLAAFATVPR